MQTDTIIGELPSGEDPETIALHPNGTTIYTANEDDALLTVIDIPSAQVITQIDVGVEPEGLAVSPDGSKMVVTSETTNMVHWIDTQTNKNYANSLVGARPRSAMFTKDSSQLWVTSEIGGQLTVFNVADQSVKHELTFAIKGIHRDRIQPVGILLMQSKPLAFVALGPSNHVAVINTQTMEIVKYLLVGRRVWQLALNQDESLLLTTNGISGDISIIDTNQLSTIKSIKVGRYPWGIAVKNDS